MSNRYVQRRHTHIGKVPPVQAPGVGSYPWLFEGLENGLSGFTLDQSHGTISWNPAGYAELVWTSEGVNSLNYPIVGDYDAVYVEYEVLRNSNHRSKQLKLPARGLGGSGKASNVTLGPTVGAYDGANAGYMGLSYSDSIAGGDNYTSINMKGVLAGGGARTRAAPTIVTAQASDVFQDVTGSVWERWGLWWKCNSVGLQNGECAVLRNGVIQLHEEDMYNCGEPEDDYRYRAAAWLGNTMQVGSYPTTECYRNFKFGVTRPLELP